MIAAALHWAWRIPIIVSTIPALFVTLVLVWAAIVDRDESTTTWAITSVLGCGLMAPLVWIAYSLTLENW